MNQIDILPSKNSLQGTIQVPGDKSISHRAIMLGSIANGITTISNFLTGEDCLSTIHAFQSLGVKIERDEEQVTIHGNGTDGLRESLIPIDLGNSGTTTRLLMGILSGLSLHNCLYGDDSLTRRPMDRVTIPLREMGATIDGREGGNLLPLSIRGGKLRSISYKLPVNSAQVKSSILLAGLFADGTTKVIEPVPTRDHTERMLKAFGVQVDREHQTISLEGQQSLYATHIDVPGDISSAAFFLAGAAMKEGSNLIIKNVGLNPTRTGIIDIIERMGASIETTITRYVGDEPIGDVSVSYNGLTGVTVDGHDIPRLIDEIPIIALLATQAKGKTIIKDAEELRYKETDRIKAVVETLGKMGVRVEGTEDGMIIEGSKKPLNGGTFESFHDHRMGMMIAISSLLTDEKIILKNPECISISYPDFFSQLEVLLQRKA